MRAEQEFDWTDDAIAELHRLHATGASYSAIGDALGITRNAAIGKARRLGLAGLRLSEEVREAKRRKRIANKDERRRCAMTNIEQLALPPRAAAPVEKSQRKRRVVSFTVFNAGPSLEPTPTNYSANALPDSQPCTLLDLTPTSCRWPLWTDDDAERLFCGAVTAGEHSYCAVHRQIASARPAQREQRTA